MQVGQMDRVLEALRADYDETPYPLNAYPESAPGQLAATAALFGYSPPPVAQARVLEIGCAVGGNLLPFAAAHPQARAVGIDLSPVQIDRARGYARAMGLTNVEFLVGDIAAIDIRALGRFDYVICHGVYSWVPESVREAILSVIADTLAANGVGYLSYNVYPGWKTKEIVRDAMLLEADALATPSDRLEAGRDIVELLHDVALPQTAPARAVADHRGVTRPDYYLLHEELAKVNAPCYFRELVGRARRHGLDYLTDARPEYTFPGNFGAGLDERLSARSGGDRVLTEQYLDFVNNRSFRQSLLVPASRPDQGRVALERNRFGDVHVAAWVPPVDGETRLDGLAQVYGVSGSLPVVTADAVQKVALDVLNEAWPWTLSHTELIESVRASLPFLDRIGHLDDRVDALLELLVIRGQLRSRLEPVQSRPDAVLRLPDSVRGLAKATQADPDACTFNAWHEIVPLTPFDRYLLPLLDGTRGRRALIEAMLNHARRHEIWFERSGRRLTDETELRTVIGRQIDDAPNRLAELKLVRADAAASTGGCESTPA
jgi:methyltransferase-like protein